MEKGLFAKRRTQLHAVRGNTSETFDQRSVAKMTAAKKRKMIERRTAYIGPHQKHLSPLSKNWALPCRPGQNGALSIDDGRPRNLWRRRLLSTQKSKGG